MAASVGCTQITARLAYLIVALQTKVRGRFAAADAELLRHLVACQQRDGPGGQRLALTLGDDLEFELRRRSIVVFVAALAPDSQHFVDPGLETFLIAQCKKTVDQLPVAGRPKDKLAHVAAAFHPNGAQICIQIDQRRAARKLKLKPVGAVNCIPHHHLPEALGFASAGLCLFDGNLTIRAGGQVPAHAGSGNRALTKSADACGRCFAGHPAISSFHSGLGDSSLHNTILSAYHRCSPIHKRQRRAFPPLGRAQMWYNAKRCS